MKKENKYFLGFFLLVLFTALLLACRKLDQPGLYYDEMLFVNGALNGKTDLFITRKLFGLPLLLMDYIGALKAWIYYPVFSIFPVNSWSVRLPAILIGLSGASLLVAALWKGFGKEAAVAGAVMILLDPTIITHSRVDWGPNALMFFWRGLLLLSITMWTITSKPKWAWIAIIAIAAGLFDKLNFIWIACAAMGALVVIYFHRLKAFAIQHRTQTILVSLIAVATIAVALLRGIILAEPTHTSWGERFLSAAFLIRLTLCGGGALDFVAGYGLRVETWFWPGYAAALVFALFGWKALFKNNETRKLYLFIALFFVLLSLAFILTKTATGVHHASVLSGIWQLLLAPALGAAWNSYSATLKIRRAFVILSLLLIATGSIITSTICINAFARPTNANWDPAITKAAFFAKDHTNADFVTSDWGIATQIIGVSEDHANVIDEWPAFTKKEDAENAIKNLNRKHETYIYTRIPEFENFKGNRNNLMYALEVNHIKPGVVKTYYNCMGKPMIEIWRIPAK